MHRTDSLETCSLLCDLHLLLVHIKDAKGKKGKSAFVVLSTLDFHFQQKETSSFEMLIRSFSLSSSILQFNDFVAKYEIKIGIGALTLASSAQAFSRNATTVHFELHNAVVGNIRAGLKIKAVSRISRDAGRHS
jgi:hypothetical protein